jgi:hypothetical protein
MGPDTGEAAHVRPFAEVLSEVSKGIVADEAATKLAELVTAVQETGKKGSVTVTIQVVPHKGNNETVNVAAAVTAKLPRAETPTSIFYIAANGNLSRNDPNTLPGLGHNDMQGASR